ncbi:hypothetical protein K0U07_04495 [bacterium]|nr:hypothetical protein [bacterium]
MKNICVGIIGGKGRLGSEVAMLCKNSLLIQKNTNLEQVIDSIDIFLDVSSADVIPTYLPLLIANQKPLVVGSTGHSPATIDAIKDAATKIPVLLAPNFSKGIYLLKKLLAHLPLTPTKIEETHHARKKDAPSGTAKALEAIFPQEIPITSYRTGDVFGDHTITYQLPGEEIRITHHATSRELFARGALDALSFLYQKEKGLYTMEQVYEDELCKR